MKETKQSMHKSILTSKKVSIANPNRFLFFLMHQKAVEMKETSQLLVEPHSEPALLSPEEKAA